jgi:succinoglycan biosynthesis protein ExoH
MPRERIGLLKEDVSKRIALLRPILILGVVFVHTSGISDNPSQLDPNLFNSIAAFFKNGVFRGTVPTMSLIAGFLLFSAGLDQAPLKMFKKKFMTLVIPFFLFNVCALALMLSTNGLLGPAFPGIATLPQSTYDAAKHIFGLSGYPINYPLHFVRDMIVTIALVPLLSVAIRTAPWIGLAALAIIFGTNQDGILVLRSSSLILFYIGGIAAVYKWDVLVLDKHATLCLAVFLALCAVYIVFGIDDNTVLVMAAPFLIWPAVSMLKGSRLETSLLGFSKYSFFVFVSHAPFMTIAWWVITRHARWIPYPVYWVCAPILVIALLKVMYDVAEKLCPRVLRFSIGARVARPVVLERRRTPRAANAPVFSPTLRKAILQA